MMKSYNMMMIFMMILTLSMILTITMLSKSMKLHPLNLMILLIIFTIMMSNKMNLMFKSWMPFILFLTMIGGLMIIFMYMTSLSNNEFFMINKFNILLIIMKFLIIMLLFKLIFMMLSLMLNFNYNNNYLNLMNSLEKKDEINLSNLFNNKKNSLMFMMLYLFYSMICIMNICYKFKNPLRQLIHYE